jgi:hypothetical protein
MNEYYAVVVSDGKEKWYCDGAASETAMEEFARSQMPKHAEFEWVDRQPYGNRPLERVLQITLPSLKPVER